MKWTSADDAVLVGDKDRLNVICALIALESKRSGKSTDFILGMVTNVIQVMEDGNAILGLDS